MGDVVLSQLRLKAFVRQVKKALVQGPQHDKTL